MRLKQVWGVLIVVCGDYVFNFKCRRDMTVEEEKLEGKEDQEDLLHGLHQQHAPIYSDTKYHTCDYPYSNVKS